MSDVLELFRFSLFAWGIGVIFFYILLSICISIAVRSATRPLQEAIEDLEKRQKNMPTSAQIQNTNEQLAWLCDYFSRR